MKGLNVLSVFDGIRVGRYALELAGVKVEKYFYSEIEKEAIQIANNNYPDCRGLGDITKINPEELERIDIFIGGSPCQSFSNMGKGEGFDGKSGLFWDYVKILNEIKKKNPEVKFLLENVKMRKEWADIITEALGVDPVLINSSMFSAQKRQRMYWTNIDFDKDIKDKGIILSDILEKNVDEKYFLEGKRLENWNKNSAVRIKKCFSSLDAEKAICMTARQYANWYGNHVTEGGRVRQLTPIECERLQTLPDNYTFGVSDAARFKALGNGWTAEVIAHIFKGLNK